MPPSSFIRMIAQSLQKHKNTEMTRGACSGLLDIRCHISYKPVASFVTYVRTYACTHMHIRTYACRMPYIVICYAYLSPLRRSHLILQEVKYACTYVGMPHLPTTHVHGRVGVTLSLEPIAPLNVCTYVHAHYIHSFPIVGGLPTLC